MSEIPPGNDPNAGVPPQGDPNQQYVQYPRSGDGGTPPGSGGFHLNFVGDSFKMIQKDLAVWIVLGLIYSIGTMVFYSPQFLFSMAMQTQTRADPGAAFGMLGGSLLIGFVSNIFMQTWAITCATSGMLIALKALRGNAISTSDLFNFNGQTAGVITAAALAGVAVTIGSYLCCIPGLIAYAVFVFAGVMAAERRLTGMDALMASAEIVKPYLGMAILTLIVLSLVSALGVIACGVGVLFTYAVMPINLAYIYRGIVGDPTPQ